MTTILDCTTCGGPMAAGRRCCPHCHCKTGPLKRIAVAAMLSVAAGCGSDAKPLNPELDLAYGPPAHYDAGVPDLSAPDMTEPPDGGDAGE